MLAPLFLAVVLAPQALDGAPVYAERAEPRALLELALDAFRTDELVFGLGASSSRGVEFRVASQAFWASASMNEALSAPTREQLHQRMEERREAVRREGGDWRARMDYAEALDAVGRAREAIDQRWEAELLLRAARAARPQDCELALDHAGALRSLGRKAQAAELLATLAEGPCASRAAIEQLGLGLGERWSGAAPNASLTAVERLRRWKELEAAALGLAPQSERAALAEQFREQRASRLLVWALSEGVSTLPPPPALIEALQDWIELLRAVPLDGESARASEVERLAAEMVLSLVRHLLVQRERLGAVLDELSDSIEWSADDDRKLLLELFEAIENGRAGRSWRVRSPALGQLVQDWREANSARLETVVRALSERRVSGQIEFSDLQRAALLDLADGGARFEQLSSQRDELRAVLQRANSAEQPLFLGLSLLAVGRFDECVDVLGAWLSAGSEQQRFLEAMRLMTYLAATPQDGAAPAIAQAEQLAFSSNAIVLGAVHGLAEDWPQARAALQAAVSGAPEDALAWQLLGYAQLSEPSTRAQAELSFERACALPGEHVARSKIGLSLAAAHRGRVEEARAAALEAALLAPQDPLARAVEAYALEALLQSRPEHSSERFNLVAQCMRACVAALRQPANAAPDDEHWRAVVELTDSVARSLLSHEPRPPAHEREALRQRAALLEALSSHWRATAPKPALEAARESLEILRALVSEGSATGAERRATARLEFDLSDDRAQACERARAALDGAVEFARGADVDDHLLRVRIELSCGDLTHALESLELAFEASKTPETGLAATWRFLTSFVADDAFDNALGMWIDAARSGSVDAAELAPLIPRAQRLAQEQLAARPDAVAPKLALARLIRLEDRGESARDRARELLELALEQVWFPTVPHLVALTECALDARDRPAALDYGLALLRRDAPARRRDALEPASSPDPGFSPAAVHEVLHVLAHELDGELERVRAAQRRWAGGDAERFMLLARTCPPGAAPAAPDCECYLEWLAAAAELGDPRHALIWIEEARVCVQNGADPALLDAPIAHVRALEASSDQELEAQLGIALWERGARCGANDDLVAAWPMLRASAQADGRDALLHLGRLYRRGEFIDADLELARELYGRAAELGSAQAAAEFGVWLIEAPRDPGDPALGRAYVERAASGGYRPAAETLVLIYERGLGGAIELERARELRERLNAAR